MEVGFIWKNIHSNEKNFKITSLPPITTPEKRESKVIVPGRSGYITDSDNTYEGEIKPVTYDYFGEDFDDIKSWLSGSDKVIFSNEPDRYYEARIINKINLEQVLKSFHSGLVQFDCQPLAHSINEIVRTITVSGYKFNYNGTAEVKPLFKVYGQGDITLTINNENVILKQVSDYITIDGNLEDAYKDTILQNNKMQGEFPILKPGENAVDFIGNVTKIEITYRAAFL